jgi:4-amino-4-deoxy-L-arabinose transferase-like glycosyltransferase
MAAPKTALNQPGGIAALGAERRLAPRWLAACRAFLRSDPILLALIPALLIVGAWHLDRYPRTWFDEGMYLQTAKNLAQHDLYAVRSADGTLDYAPAVGVGPTTILPVALFFRLGGDSLALARLVPLVALLLATVLLYLLARSLFGRLAAGCALLLLLCLPALDWIATGRQVLGEVPAVLFLLAGGILAHRTPASRLPILGGVLLGLAMVTKGQYLLVLPAAIVAIALLDRFVTRQRPLHWYLGLLVAAGVVYACWFAALLTVVQHGQLIENYRQLRASSGGALLIINRGRMIAAVRFLLGPQGFFLVIPATIAGAWAVWRAEGQRRLALLSIWVFQSLWLLWFTGASIAWPRYAFPALVLNTLFMGYLAAQLLTVVRGAAVRRAWRTPAAQGSAVALLLLVLLIARGAWGTFVPIASADQREPQAFAQAVEVAVPPGATIDAWEPEIGFLTDRTIQYPPLGSLDRVVRARWLAGGGEVDLSDTLRGDYLIVGPFAGWVGVYATATNSPQYHRIAQVGPYELYQRTSARP